MQWDADLAYIVGLITADGNLSKDGRHIDLTSKDLEQIKTFARILMLRNKIGIKSNSKNQICYRIQFGSVVFYRFLLDIGLTPNKSKTINSIKIPKKYFADFLRGIFDGDGCTFSYFDKRWKNSFLFYMSFISGSPLFLKWLKNKINDYYNIEGKIGPVSKSAFQLRFAKANTILLIKKMYYDEKVPCLIRKRSKIIKALDIIRMQAGVEKLVYSQS